MVDRVLRYFLTVAQEQNFTRAAEKLHLTQPTLSRQLRELELTYGTDLFNRGARRVTLTEKGMLLRRRAEEILSLVEKTEGEIGATEESVSGEVRIGAGESIHFGYIMDVAAELRRKYPKVRFQIITGDGSAVMYQLDRGLIDFAFAYGKMDPEKYAVLELPEALLDKWGILLPGESELAKQSVVTAKDLQAKPLLFSRQVLSSSTHGDALRQWFGCPLEELTIAGSFTMLYNGSLMVKAGLGYALALDKIVMADVPESTLCFRPLDPPVYAKPAIIWRKQAIFSEPSQIFLASLREAVQGELGRAGQ